MLLLTKRHVLIAGLGKNVLHIGHARHACMQPRMPLFEQPGSPEFNSPPALPRPRSPSSLMTGESTGFFPRRWLSTSSNLEQLPKSHAHSNDNMIRSKEEAVTAMRSRFNLKGSAVVALTPSRTQCHTLSDPATAARSCTPCAKRPKPSRCPSSVPHLQ